MAMNAAVTVIVPVFQAEKFIERCCRSLFGQTMDNMEFIFVNDGSKDNSINIIKDVLKDFPDRSQQVKIIDREENRGVAYSRQEGLDNAVGDFIIFCDSDDWIEPNMYEHLYNDAVKTKADCVVCGFFGQSKRRVKKMCRTEKALKLLFLPSGFGGFSFLRLIAAEKVRNIRYDTTISYMEDVKFFYEAFKNCKSVYWDNEPLYHYEQNTTSVTHQFGLTKNAKSALQMLETLQMSEQKKDISRAVLIDKLCFCIALALMYIKNNEINNPSFVSI